MRVAEPHVLPAGDLLERDGHLDELRAALDEVTQGCGRFVFVAGEAGVGKTSLLRHFCDDAERSGRVLWGACDSLFTPRALGPLLDVARATGGDFDRLVHVGARPHEVHDALVAELRHGGPTILVLENIHWADEATLDVLKLLGRRIANTEALVLASYRDDELDSTHLLRLVLGELARVREVSRLELAPLTQASVTIMAAPYGVDADELHRTTGGNPFFVTEVLAAGVEGAVPQTVRDAVLARAARLTPGGRALLEAVAVVPPEAELPLLELLAGGDLGHLDECLASGILTADSGSVAFRHELARLVFEESLPPTRRVELHQRALAAFAESNDERGDLARLAHHAEAARDAAAVLQFAPAAASLASSLGAHREAAAQYARALRHSTELPPEEQAELLKRRAWECYLTDQAEEAVKALESAVSCYRELGDRRSEGDTLRRLSNVLWCPGRIDEAKRAALEAVALLEQLTPGHELAMAYNGVSQLNARAENREDAVRWGRRALDLAQRLEDVEAQGYALNNIGSMEFLERGIEARETLERSLELGKQIENGDLITRALYNLARVSARHRAYDLARGYLESGFEHCRERNVEILDLYLLSLRARLELDQGRWNEALEAAMPLVLRERCRSIFPRTGALVVLGLIRARRGDPDVWPPLDEALALAKPTGELPRIAMVTFARAEAAWLEGRLDAVLAETESAFALGLGKSRPLKYWRWRAGAEEAVVPRPREPYSLEMAGDWKLAAELWDRFGCPYEAAVARLGADDESPLRTSLSALRQLGAQPAAAMVTRRLRELGVRGIARGPRPTTQANPALLTLRELEVLQLVAQGLRNAEIAARLFVSTKTIDHHVSSILRKLDARTRGEASETARRLGLYQAR